MVTRHMLKEHLLAEFNSCYNHNGWFVAVRNVIDGINADEALWKPDTEINSIWQTLEHLTFYNHAYIERFKGNDYTYPTDNNDETFSAGMTDADWQAAISKFDATMREFHDLIKAADESKFSQPVSAANNASWAQLISKINTHNAYHGGQILLLRKLQGKWDPKKGVS